MRKGRSERVAARIASLAVEPRAPREGVIPLAAGHFHLERIRTASVASRRAKLKAVR